MDMLQRIFLMLCCYCSYVNAQTNLGGIYSQHSPNIVIEQQNINISPDMIKIMYSFRNTLATPIHETLGFSFPNYGEENTRQFSVTVNHIPLQYQTTQRAINNNGNDISVQLRALGIPFDPVAAMHHLDASSNRSSMIARLRSIKAIDKEDLPLWMVKTFYFWQQEFPPNNSIVIEQTYKPTSNNTQLSLNAVQGLLKMPLRLIKKAVRMAIYWSADDVASTNLREFLERQAPQIKNYCPDKSDFNVLAMAYKKPMTKSTVEIKEIELAINNNDIWTSPVSNFSLKIEAPENMHPLICWNDKLDVSKNSSLRFTAENYIPMQNIQVMYIEK